jgi:endonuclease/exonuclease/phosphatase (EEP) superfamily protein YafD
MKTGWRRICGVSTKGLVEAAGWIGVCASVFGWLGGLGWWLDLFSNFRPQLAVGMTVLTVAAAGFKLRRQAFVFATVAFVQAAFLWPLFSGDGTAFADEGAATLSLLTINVNSENTDYETVRTRIREANADIVLVEELTPEWHWELQKLTEDWLHTLEVPQVGCFGIMLMSRVPLNEVTVIDPSDSGRPSIRASLTLAGRKLVVLGTHPVPPKNSTMSAWRNLQLDAIAQEAARSADLTVVFGDLNATRFSSAFSDFLSVSGLVNSENGFGWQPSWPAGQLHWLLGVGIDHVLVSPEIRVAERRVLGDIGSDHYPVYVKLQIPPKAVPY